MEFIERGQFKIYYSGESRLIAERLLTISEKAYPVFKEIFAAEHDIFLEIYWADKKDWFNIPWNRYKSSYGMPHMTKGSQGKHYIILPAANIDMPDRLVETLEPMLQISYLKDDEASRLAELLIGEGGSGKEALREYIDSQAFYVDYLINIVNIHEMMHDFCFEFGLPENYGRNNQKAWWVFEGMAQWSVLWINRRIENSKWAEIHEKLYRWIYLAGRDKERNKDLVNYCNYAWFHGSLVEMFVQLEKKFGHDYGMKVFQRLLKKIHGRNFIDDEEVITVFSEAAGQDLSLWFKNNWGIPSEKV